MYKYYFKYNNENIFFFSPQSLFCAHIYSADFYIPILLKHLPYLQKVEARTCRNGENTLFLQSEQTET